MVNESELARLPDSELACLRCETAMKSAGPMQFHEGRRWGALGELGELMVKRLRFEVYICPSCGKTEFFL